MKQNRPAKSKLIFFVRIFLLIGGIILTITLPPWRLTWAWANPFPRTIQAEVDQTIGYGYDGIMVYSDVAGMNPESYSAGWHNKEKEIEAYPEALFKIGSVDKLYTAIAITKLVSKQELSFDGTVAEYLPELALNIDNSSEINLEMMIKHKSGIPNFTDTSSYWENPPNSDESKLALIKDLSANFEPNDGYEYSNTNFLLLRMIINETLDQTYQEFIQTEIIDKLELKNTYFSLSEIELDSVMSGYYLGIDEDIKTANYGSMISNMEDTAKLIRALNDGSILDEEEQKIYPYVYDHGGLLAGYQVLTKYNQESDRVTILVVNTTNFSDYQNLGIPNIILNRIISKLEQ